MLPRTALLPGGYAATEAPPDQPGRPPQPCHWFTDLRPGSQPAARRGSRPVSAEVMAPQPFIGPGRMTISQAGGSATGAAGH